MTNLGLFAFLSIWPVTVLIVLVGRKSAWLGIAVTLAYLTGIYILK